MTNESEFPQYKYRGLPLSPSIIAELLAQEIFDGRLPPTFQRRDVTELVARIHLERGGVRSSTDPAISVKKALASLRQSGVLEQPVGKYWRVVRHDSASEQGQDEPTSVPLDNVLVEEELSLPTPRLTIEQEIGEGEAAVYVYYFANDRRLAELQNHDVWECKIGMTVGDVAARVLGQLSQTAVHSLPVIGLVARTPEARNLETALHGILRAAGTHCRGDATGIEWFRTSPDQVTALVTDIQNWIKRLGPPSDIAQ